LQGQRGDEERKCCLKYTAQTGARVESREKKAEATVVERVLWALVCVADVGTIAAAVAVIGVRSGGAGWTQGASPVGRACKASLFELPVTAGTSSNGREVPVEMLGDGEESDSVRNDSEGSCAAAAAAASAARDVDTAA
jgi:hypothetical protein